MISKSRKFKIIISSILPCTAEEIFTQISIRHKTRYVGIYDIMGDRMCIYVHLNNVLDPLNIKKIVKGMGIKIDGISTYVNIEGSVHSQHGVISVRGRPKKNTNPETLPPLSLPPLPTPNYVPVYPMVLPRTLPLDFPHDRFPEVTDPSRNFHAIWGSHNGYWFPLGYVGPECSIVPGKRRSVTARQSEELFKAQDSLCALCGCEVFMGKMSNADIDHIIPLKLGGSCCTSNLQILCVTCHRRKTAYECKKLRCNVCVSYDFPLEPGALYISCSDVTDPDYEVLSKNPKEALSNRDGLFKLVY